MKPLSLIAVFAGLFGAAIFYSCSPCPTVNSCAVTDPFDWTFTLAQFTPPSTASPSSTIHINDIDPSWKKTMVDSFWKSIPYPHVEYEIITDRNDNAYEHPNAMEYVCPCDSTLAILNFENLTTEEISRAGDPPQPSEGEGEGQGEGNMYIPIPRFVGNTQLNFNDYGDIWEASKGHFGQGHPNSSRPRTLPLIAILDTGVDEGLMIELIRKGAISKGDYLQTIYPDAHPLNVEDDNGHGSNVTAIIDNFALGQARYLIYKTHDSLGLGNTFSVICALRCAMQQNPDIINMSFGAYNSSDALKWELEQIMGKDDAPIIIASKGNDGVNTDDLMHIPSDYLEVIGVTGLKANIVLYDMLPTGGRPGPPVHWECSNMSVNRQGNIAAPAMLMGGSSSWIGTGTSYSAALATGVIARLPETGRRPPFGTATISDNVWHYPVCNTIDGSPYKFMTIE